MAIPMSKRFVSIFVVVLIFVSLNGCKQSTDNYYTNPLYFADYSDPDVIRVGNDFYMVTSSFTYSPGLPIYHSKDLVHWQQIGNVVDRHAEDFFDVPRHGMGIWAPSIRYHNNYFWVYYGDPDFGIYMTKAMNHAGPWEPLTLVHAGKGLIDPCPFWDDDGNAYLVRAWAKSRAGINSVLVMHRMSPEGDKLLDDGVMIFDGTETQPTIEGPKMYKRNGYYYIFAPAGGVTPGWQTVLRSKDVFGPYEERVVMHQGDTDTNGPHQGGWVELESGEHWFLHFQCNGAYGRMPHLNPLVWQADDWPIIGIDSNDDGIGEPVSTFQYPNTGNPITYVPQLASDEFDGEKLMPQWRWQANYRDEWYSLTENTGCLRLYSYPVENENLLVVPQVITQKFPAEEFTATAKLNLSNLENGDITGLAAMGNDYATVRIAKINGEFMLSYAARHNADADGELKVKESHSFESDTVLLTINVSAGAICSFSFSADGNDYITVGSNFQAKRLRWVGSSIALYCFGSGDGASGGSVDIDWVRVDYFDKNPIH
jgi:beta-xylosidase